MFSTNLKQFILSGHTQSMPNRVPIPDHKVEVRRLAAIEELSFPGAMSRTHITIDRVKMVLWHAMQNLVSLTRVPEDVQDFLHANAFASTCVQQGVLHNAYA